MSFPGSCRRSSGEGDSISRGDKSSCSTNAKSCERNIFTDAPSTTKVSAYLWWNSCYLITIVCCLAFILGPILYPQTVGLFFFLPYVSYTVLLRRDELMPGGNRWRWFSREFPAFRCLQSYLDLELYRPLPAELVKMEQAPEAQFVFAAFPHGASADYRVLMDGMLHHVLPNVADKICVLSASVLFRIPFVRELSIWTGCVDARRSVAEAVLDAGRSILVLPGGMEEQIRTERGREVVYLSKRKGFIKLAMRRGVPVVPLYVFGCSDMFHTSKAFFDARHWIMRTFGACIPFSAGLAWSACPLPVTTTIVFGEPLSFRVSHKGMAPNAEELDAAHSKFSDALLALFDEHKGRLGYGNRTLEII